MTIRKSFILEDEGPIRHSSIEEERARLNTQYMVAVALTENPVILNYLIDQAEAIMYDLAKNMSETLHMDATTYKLYVEKQKAALAVYKHLYSLASNKAVLEQTIRRNTPQQ